MYIPDIIRQIQQYNKLQILGHNDVVNAIDIKKMLYLATKVNNIINIKIVSHFFVKKIIRYYHNLYIPDCPGK